MSQLPIHLRTYTSPETFAHADFIANICKFYKPNVYIEYGLSTCITTSAVAPWCKRIIGVDIAHHSNMNLIPHLEFYKMKTSDFAPILNNMNVKIDVAFIDACHKSSVVVQDFNDIWPHMEDNGMIFLHDTFPVESHYLADHYCSDCYLVPSQLKALYKDTIELVTIPIQPGLTMVRKVKALDFHITN